MRAGPPTKAFQWGHGRCSDVVLVARDWCSAGLRGGQVLGLALFCNVFLFHTLDCVDLRSCLKLRSKQVIS
eukprot:6211382-Pleurochrysis_carterae.AAC.2